MLWILLAISSHFFWALVNLGDKYIVSHRVRNPYVYMMWLGLFGILLSICFIPFVDFFIPPLHLLLLLLFAGSTYFFGGLPYIRAMQLEEPTRVNVWWNLIPIFILLIEVFLLKRTFSGIEFAAFFVLIFGAVVGSIHVRRGAVFFSRAFFYMVAAGITFAIAIVTIDYVTQFVSFWVTFIWTNIFSFLSSLSLLCFASIRKEYREGFRTLDMIGKSGVIGVSIFEHIGILLNHWALFLGSPTLILSLEGTQVLFVFFIATTLSFLAPRVMKEEIDKGNLLVKISAIALMLIGILLLRHTY